MSFGTVPAGTTFGAAAMGDAQLAGLELADGQNVLAAWDFTTNFAGGWVLLAFDVGGLDLGDGCLNVYHYDGTTWAAFPAADLMVDSSGIASFTAGDFSGYAVTAGPVPEPATLSLLALASMAMLRRKRNFGFRIACHGQAVVWRSRADRLPRRSGSVA